jgi:A/G-specific adenine glycosylase
VSLSPSIDRARLRRRLLGWFDRHARDLPWRRSRDPYPIWVSEVMLQQTTVTAVVPYFERFLARFPTLPDLAAASQADVLRLWEGLGYYRRARDLHRSAQLIAERHGGEWPRDEAAVRALPGLGRYTANAVLSQAFDVKLPILEANSARLLCRLAAVADDPKSPAALKGLWRLAESLLPSSRVGDFNQALMELGALVCTPNEPRCGECPLAALCQAKALGLTETIPAKTPRPKIEVVRETAVVLWRKGAVFLAQRPPTGRWAEMWEFPRIGIQADQSPETAAAGLMRDLGFEVDIDHELTTIRHGVTRFRITLVCLEGRHRAGTFRAGVYPRGEWVVPERLIDYPVSSPQRQLAKLVLRERERPLF